MNERKKQECDGMKREAEGKDNEFKKWNEWNEGRKRVAVGKERGWRTETKESKNEVCE